MNKLFNSFQWKLTLVIFWGAVFGAVAIGAYRPSRFLIAGAYLIIFINSLKGLLE